MNTLDRLPPSEQKKIAAWTICRPYGDRPLADWRIDAFNNPIRRSDYGKQTEYGWEIDQGMVLRDGEQHLVFFHFDEYVWNRWFRVTVKRCNEQRKLWVSTFHKTKWGQVRGKLKRLELLREEKDRGGRSRPFVRGGDSISSLPTKLAHRIQAQR